MVGCERCRVSLLDRQAPVLASEEGLAAPSARGRELTPEEDCGAASAGHRCAKGCAVKKTGRLPGSHSSLPNGSLRYEVYRIRDAARTEETSASGTLAGSYQ
jgi:hypothetical protein